MTLVIVASLVLPSFSAALADEPDATEAVVGGLDQGGGGAIAVGECPSYSNTAKAPAITLGVLSALGGILFLGAAMDLGPEDGRGGIMAIGLINVGLGAWGIIGGAVSD